ncbi:PfkB family carbohydrate kinase [uncultured Massilia sp.]|uniref:PfkB family carbohydrate kinase n=1 Tax=uncultured Massilia sp. TaxID=169973 RepID=UPI00258B4286|nr:PfkB family carbohydrate kinase [uncultured Massilia sp.]
MNSAAATAPCLVFGEALVDDFSTEQVVGGAPFNVARHLAAFMAPQLLVTRIGNDAAGQAVRAEFERFAMSEAGLQLDAMEETGRVLVERSARAHRFTILPNQAYDFIDRDTALTVVEAAQPGIVYFGTLAQRNERSRTALNALLGATGALRYLDLNLREGQYEERTVTRSLQAANIAKVNEEELQVLFKSYFQIKPDDPALSAEEVRASCQALLQMFSLDALILTLGHRGSAYFSADGQVITHRDNPAPPFVIDTVGAGDAFSAIFLLGKMRGWELDVTLARANEFAGAICAIPGAVPRDLGFYDQWMRKWR